MARRARVYGGEMDGEYKGKKGWCRGWEVAGCCHPAVCRLKAHSGVNLLEELESSAGCHLFSTRSTLPPSPPLSPPPSPSPPPLLFPPLPPPHPPASLPPPLSLSPSVNRVISAALVPVLQHHISLYQSNLALLAITLTTHIFMNKNQHTIILPVFQVFFAVWLTWSKWSFGGALQEEHVCV